MCNQHLLIFLLACVHLAHLQSVQYIDNFNGKSTADEWYEVSDTEKHEGESKAVISLLTTKKFKRAVFFALLNPDEGGAGFASVFKNISLDFTPYNSIVLNIRGQGEFRNYKVVLKQINETSRFCHDFKAPSDFNEITLPLKDFKPFHNGQPVNDTDVVLRKDLIFAIGLYAGSGTFIEEKQKGVASVEIDWIKVQ